MTHLTGELIKSLTGIDMLHIVYRGGTPAMNDLLAGHLPLQFATVAQALPQYKAGQLRALGISSAERYASVPEIPTFKEQGIDVVTTEWYGLLAPAGTPRPIVDKLNAEMKRITALPGMGDRLAAIELTHSTPEELRQLHQGRDRALGRGDQEAGTEGGVIARRLGGCRPRPVRPSVPSGASIAATPGTVTKSDPETASSADRAGLRRTPSAGRARPSRRLGEIDLVGDLAREAHLVGDDHAGHALLGEFADRHQHLLDGLGIERRRHLVEQHHVRIHRERARDRDALLLAAGQLARIGVLLALRAAPSRSARAPAPRPPSCRA